MGKIKLKMSSIGNTIKGATLMALINLSVINLYK